MNQVAVSSNYQRVYIDETSINTYIYRSYARALKGQTIKSRISGKKYQRTSIVAAQIDNKLIVPMIYENTMNSEFFEAWFEQCLLPSFSKQSVIIMDNASFSSHECFTALGTEILSYSVAPLSPYSPELNLIEHTWANIKRYLRKVLPNFGSFWEGLVSYYGFN